jgi:hypothetical protein
MGWGWAGRATAMKSRPRRDTSGATGRDAARTSPPGAHDHPQVAGFDWQGVGRDPGHVLPIGY